MTYPNQKVDEVLKAFVCIRVDFDREPDLTKQYGTKPLPDLRLLDPDGKELEKLLGFQSPERLARECQRALDRLAGKESTESRSGSRVRDVPVTEAKVAAAVQRGCEFLQAQVADGLPRGGVPGIDDAVLWGLSGAGKGSGNAAIMSLVKRVLAEELTGTYQVAFQALALARLDAKAHRTRLAECARFLANSQQKTGLWSYGADPTASGDHSNGAYAVLGLDACARAGVEVPREVIARAATAWRQAQNADGGWGYRKDREVESYASMTESGIATLLLCKALGAGDPADGALIERARAWLQAHFAVDQNAGSSYQQGRLLYHLYALERAGTLLAARTIGEHDWHREGAAFLLGTQREDGSWDDGADTPAANTAFALLFLTRATEFR